MAYTDHPVWMFPVNWAGEVKETLEWRTDVLTSEVEAEQRVARRLTPRKTLTATFMLEKENRQYMQNMLARYGASDWLIPLWHQSSFLSAPALAGSSSLQLDTRWREYAVGGFIILRSRDPQIFEVGVITTLADNLVTLQAPLERNWPQAYTFAYPGAIARPDASVTATKLLDNVQAINTNFSLAQTNPYPSEWVGDSYDGSPVLSIRPDDSEDLTLEYRRKQVIVDNELGVPLVYDISNRSVWVTQYRWSEAGREQLDALRRMLYWLRGAAKTIWVPTFMQDFTLALPTAIGGQSLHVKNAGFARIHGVNAQATIQITLRSGAALRCSVTGASGGAVGSATEVLALAAPLAQAVNPGEIAYICLLLHARLLDDTVDIRHPTDADGMASANVRFTSAHNVEENSTLGGPGGSGGAGGGIPDPGLPGTGWGIEVVPPGGGTDSPNPIASKGRTVVKVSAISGIGHRLVVRRLDNGSDCGTQPNPGSPQLGWPRELEVNYTHRLYRYDKAFPGYAHLPFWQHYDPGTTMFTGVNSGRSYAGTIVLAPTPPKNPGTLVATYTALWNVASGAYCWSGFFTPGAYAEWGEKWQRDYYEYMTDAWDSVGEPSDDDNNYTPYDEDYLGGSGGDGYLAYFKTIQVYDSAGALLSDTFSWISRAEYSSYDLNTHGHDYTFPGMV